MVGSVSRAGPLAAAEALAFDGHMMRVVSEPIEGALGQDRIVEERHPFLDGAVQCGAYCYAGSLLRRPRKHVSVKCCAPHNRV